MINILKKSIVIGVSASTMMMSQLLLADNQENFVDKDIYDISYLECSEVMQCALDLDAERNEMAKGINFIWDNLKLIGGVSNSSENSINHQYYLIKELDGLEQLEVEDLMFDADSVLETIYCTDPMLRLAMDEGLSVGYSLKVSLGGVVSDSGYKANPFNSEACENFDTVVYSQYEDVLKFRSVKSTNVLDNITEEVLDTNSDILIDVLKPEEIN